MAGKSVALLDRQGVGASELGNAIDLGAFNSLHTFLKIHVAGSAGNIKLQHAAVDELTAWRDLTSTYDINSTGNYEVHNFDFLRYVRWATSSNVAGSPSVSLYVVAKE